jgi:hypothetical protein
MGIGVCVCVGVEVGGISVAVGTWVSVAADSGGGAVRSSGCEQLLKNTRNIIAIEKNLFTSPPNSLNHFQNIKNSTE